MWPNASIRGNHYLKEPFDTNLDVRDTECLFKGVERGDRETARRNGEGAKKHGEKKEKFAEKRGLNRRGIYRLLTGLDLVE